MNSKKGFYHKKCFSCIKCKTQTDYFNAIEGPDDEVNNCCYCCIAVAVDIDIAVAVAVAVAIAVVDDDDFVSENVFV